MQIISSMFRPSGRGLEIGPGYNPIVSKSSGADVEILDHLDQAGLVEKYRHHPNVNISHIEPVDFVLDDRSMVDLINRTKHYDYIIASHVIEHTVDFISFLRDCDALLRDGGSLLLVVPDKRYCFDVFRPVSSTGDVLQAFWDKRTRHTRGTIFDHFASAAQRGGSIAWSSTSEGEIRFLHTFEEAVFRSDEARDPTLHVDCHAWQFTPASFRLILHDLHAMGLLSLREQSFHDTEGCEFFVSLSRVGHGPPHGRLALAEMALREAARASVSKPDREVAVDATAPSKQGQGALGPKSVPFRSLKKMLKRARRAVHG